jgi:hypothetical protein
MTKSTTIFLGLLVILAACAYVSVYLPMGNFIMTSSSNPALDKIPKHVLALANTGVVLALYGILGGLGLKLSRKAGFPAVWDERISLKQRLLTPALIGLFGGGVLILGDLIFSRFNTIGNFIHPPFPTSLVASLAAAIGEEIIYRLFFLSFWIWVLSLFFKQNRELLFWAVAGFAALAFASAHFPTFFLLYGYKNIVEMPTVLVWEIVLLNGIIGLLCAWQFKKAGYLAALGTYFTV